MKRKHKSGATYYVTSEINRNEMDLKSSLIKAMFLIYLQRAQQKYPFRLINFCIMDNYIHLLIKPAKGQSISTIMQWLKGNFAREWNRVHNKKSGHLWGKRFFSEIVEDESRYLQIFKSIDRAPVNAGLVQYADDWEFGGLYHHLHGRLDVADVPRIDIFVLFQTG